ncbi:helix-turn-helix domain-containing protein [Singulisphaera sp. PoT]|uniref:helix-turn-helix domain-containing protein n=1 Tax=Singulisphaera sp. PoT TaxID=3411797 RepID=UPI003BF5E00E
MDDTELIIADRLTIALGRRDWTQRRLADAVGLTPQQVNKVTKRERSLDCHELFRISRAMEIPMEWFLDASIPVDEIERRSGPGPMDLANDEVTLIGVYRELKLTKGLTFTRTIGAMAREAEEVDSTAERPAPEIRPGPSRRRGAIPPPPFEVTRPDNPEPPAEIPRKKKRPG